MLGDFINSGPGRQRELYQKALDRIAELEGPVTTTSSVAETGGVVLLKGDTHSTEDLSKLTVAELRSRCQTADIVGYGKMRKAELVEALG